LVQVTANDNGTHPYDFTIQAGLHLHGTPLSSDVPDGRDEMDHMPLEPRVGDFLETISYAIDGVPQTLANETLRAQSITPGQVVVQGRYSRVPIQVALRGSLAQVEAFCQQLPGFERTMVVRSLAWTAASNDTLSGMERRGTATFWLEGFVLNGEQ
jgi:hypothetical protein